VSGATGSDTGAAAVLAGGTEPAVTSIEQRGIEHVPSSSRWGGPSSLFWMWAGAVWNVEFVVYGGLAVVVFGLSFAQAVVIILIGNLFYTLFAINTIDLYSSGVTLQSLIPRLKRLHCVAIDTVVCGAFAAYAVFSSRFFSLLADFLLFIIVWLGPWCAIYLIDAWLRRNRYDNQALLNERGGRYYRNGGVHWPAIIAQVVGMVAAALWLNAYSPYVSPLSNHVDGSDFSVFMGLFFGGVTYFLLAGRSVKAEAAQCAPAEAGQST
jgi:purine-cytosine permease-like protein